MKATLGSSSTPTWPTKKLNSDEYRYLANESLPVHKMEASVFLSKLAQDLNHHDMCDVIFTVCSSETNKQKKNNAKNKANLRNLPAQASSTVNSLTKLSDLS